MLLEIIEVANAKNNKQYHKLTIDGKHYNFFGDMKDLKAGDQVLCDFEVKGQYTNLKTIVKQDGAVVEKVPSVAVKNDTLKDVLILIRDMCNNKLNELQK